jgi:beta-galactosidase
LVVSIEDKYGNALPYQLKPVTLTVEGDGQLIGENPLILLSGTAGFFVKAGKKAGSIIVKAKVAGFEEESITILVS